MKNPEKAASGSGSGDDTCRCCLAAWLQCGSGRLPEPVLRLSPAGGQKSPDSGRCDFFSGNGVGMDLALLCGVPGRYPDGVSSGHGNGFFALGAELRTVAPAGMDRILERIGLCFSVFSASLEKIFGNYKNFGCICGKMGYNKVYENL